jgi:hypothetical protein
MAVNPQIKTLDLRPSKAPNLPIAPVDYRQQYIDQLNNALRLYFNQIDNGLSSLFSNTGGAGLSLPHIAASDSTDQYATADNTPTVVAFDTLDSGLGFDLQAPGTAIAQVSGTYKITYSAQLVNTDNAIHTATFWLRVNTVDVINSATIFSIPARKSALVPSYVAGYSEVTFTVQADDEIELYWATEKAYDTSPATDGVYIFHDDAWTVAGGDPYARPAVPSVIGSITFVSRLP